MNRIKNVAAYFIAVNPDWRIAKITVLATLNCAAADLSNFVNSCITIR